MPNAAGGNRPGPCPVLIRSNMSTLALATPMAGTTQSLQLHCMPCHANLPMLNPQALFGQVRRPESGASSEDEASGVLLGKRHGRIHVSGCRKTCAQSFDVFAPFCGPCGMTNGVVASVRLFDTV